MATTEAQAKTVIPATSTPSIEKIPERKTIVYETRTDPTVIKVAGEKLKEQLFTRFGFLKPRPEEIQLVSTDKYYEPFMMVSGKYAIDYYRKCAYVVKVDKKVLEVILLNQKLQPTKPNDSGAKEHNVVRLEGEERLMTTTEASLILDRYGRDVTVQKLPSAPSEKNPKKILMAYGVAEIPRDADLNVIRSKILKRPKDVSRLVSEVFEVSERVVIYTPRFRVKYKNVRTGEEKTMDFDGVTADRIHPSRYPSFPVSGPPLPPV